MALNPQLVSVAQAYGKTLPFPAPYAGEVIFSSREHSDFKLDGPRQYKYDFQGLWEDSICL